MPALAQVLPVAAALGGATTTNFDVGTHIGFGLDVNLNDANRVINWSSFNIGSASSKFETVKFSTADTATSFAVLNRVAAGNPSSIFGQITSQPKITVWLVNPSGITFGPTGGFSGGALVLSTGALAVLDEPKFLGGVLPFSLTGHDTAAGATGIVLQAGSGLLATAGPIVLIAQTIDASGSISATAGDVALVAATDVVLPNAFGSPLAITITKGTALGSAKVDAKGAIDGTNVRFYGARQADVTAALLNVSAGATLTATAVGGKVVLAAGTAAAGTDLSFAGALPADIDGVANIGMAAGTLTATGLGGTVFAAANGSLSGAASLVANTTGGAITLISGGDITGALKLSATGGGATVTLPAAKDVALGDVATRNAFTLDTTGTIATGNLTVTNGSVLLRTTSATGGSITAGTINAFNNVTVDAHTSALVASAAAGVANGAGPLPDPNSDVKVDAVTTIDFGGGTAPRDITLTAANGYAKVTGPTIAGRNVAISALNDTATVASDVTATTGFYTVDGKAVVLGAAGIVPVTQQAAGFVRIGGLDAVNGLGALTLQSNSGGAVDAADARTLQLSATAGPINFAATTSLLGGTAKQSLLVLGTATPISLGLVRARRLVPLGSLGAPVFTTAGDFTAADLGVAGDLAITTTAGSIRLGAATSDTGDIRLTATAGDISGLATVAPGNLVPNFDRADLTASAADRIVDAVARRVQLGTVTAGTGSTILGIDQIHVGAEAFDVTAVDARNGNVTLTATAGTATLGTGTVRGNLQVDATAAAAVTGAVTAGGFYTVSGSTATLGNAATVTQKAGDYVRITATSGAITGRPNLTLQSNSGGAADATNTRYLQLLAAGAIDFGPATSLLGGTANQSVLALDAGTTIGLGTVRARRIVPTADLTAAAFTTAGDFIASDIIVADTLDVTSTGGSIRIGQATSQTGNIALTTTSGVAGSGNISGLATVALPLSIDDYGRADLTSSAANTTITVRALGATPQTAKLGTLTAGSGTGLLATDQVYVTATTVDVSTITARNGNMLLVSTADEARLGTGSARGNATVQAATSARIGSLTAVQGNVDVRALAGDVSGLKRSVAAGDGRLLAGYDRADLAANAANATVFAQGSNVQLGTVTAGSGTGLLAADQITISGTAIDATTATASNGNLFVQSSVGDVVLAAGSGRGNATAHAAASARIGSLTAVKGNVDVRALAGDVSGLKRSVAAGDGRLLTGYDRADLAANAANATVSVQGSNVQLGTVTAGSGTGLLAADQITILGTAIDATTATAGNGNLVVLASVGEAILATGSARGNATVRGGTSARIGSLTSLAGGIEAKGMAGDVSGLALSIAAVDGRLLTGYGRSDLTAATGIIVAGNGVQLGAVIASGDIAVNGGNAGALLDGAVDVTSVAATDGNFGLTSYSAATGAPIYNGRVVLGSGTTDRTIGNPAERDGTITASGTVDLGSARTSRTLTITAGKTVTVAGPVTAGEHIAGDYLVTGSSVTLAGTTQSASGRVDIHATGTLPGDGVTGLAGLVLVSNRDSAGSAPLTLRADGGAGIDFATGTALYGGTAAGVANRTADIGVWSPLAKLALGTVTARSLQGLDAGHTVFGTLSAPNMLNVAGNVDLRAPVTLAGALNLVSATGTITTRAITIGTPGTGSADRFLTMTSTLGTITAADALLSDGNLTLNAKGAVALLSATSRLGDIAITSLEGDVTGLGGVSGSYAPFAIGALGSAGSPAGSVTLTLPDNASITAIDATGDIALTGSNIRLGRANSTNGVIGITAAGALTGIGTAAGSGIVPPIPGADLTASASTGSITVNAGGAILKTAQLHTVTAGRDVTVTADSIAIDSAAATNGTLRLNAGSLLALGHGFGSAIVISGSGGTVSPLADPDYALNILDRNFGATDLTATANGKTITLGAGTIAQLGFVTAGSTATPGSAEQIGITAGLLTVNTLTARNGDVRATATGPLYVRIIDAANSARLVKTGNSPADFDELRLDTLTSGTAPGSFGDVVVASATDARIGTLTATNGDVQLSSTAASADRGLVQIGSAATSGTIAGHRDMAITARRIGVTIAAGAVNGSVTVIANQTGAARNEVGVVATRLFAGTDLAVDVGLGTGSTPTADNGSLRLGTASAMLGSITLSARDGDLTGLAALGVDAIDATHGRMLLTAGTNIALTAGGLIQTGPIAATSGTITAAAGDVFAAGLAANDGAIDISQATAGSDLSLWAKAMTALGRYNGDIRLGSSAAGLYDGASATTSGGIARLTTAGLRGDIIVASALASTGDLTLASTANVRIAGGDVVSFSTHYVASTAGKVAVSGVDVSGLAGSGPLVTGYARGDVSGFGGVAVTGSRVQLGTVRTTGAAADPLSVTAGAIDIVDAQASRALALTATSGRLFLNTGTAGTTATLIKQGSGEELRVTGNLLAGSDVLIDTATNARLPEGSATTRVTSTAGNIGITATGDVSGLALGSAAIDGRLLPGFGRADLTTLDTGTTGKSITVTAANAQLGAVNAGGTSLASLASVTAGAIDIVSATSAGALALTATSGRLFLDTGTAGTTATLIKQGSGEELRLFSNLLAGGDIVIDTQTSARLPGGAADRFVRSTAGDITVTARSGDVTGAGGVTAGPGGFAAGDLTSFGNVTATLPDNAAIGTITAAGDITLTSGHIGDIRLGSAITSGGSILIDAKSGALTGTSAGGFTVAAIAGSDLFATGTGHSITVTAGTGGALSTAQLGTVRADRNITVTADRIAIDDAQAATGALTLNAGSSLALRLGSGGSIALTGTGDRTSAATPDYPNDLLDTGYGATNLTASADGKTVTIRAGSIAQLGSVAAGTTASTGVTNQIDITGGAVTADALTARNAAMSVSATNGPLYVHTVVAANAATFIKTGNAGTGYDEIRLRTVTSGSAPGSTGTLTVASDTSARLGNLTAATGDVAITAKAGDVSGLLLPVASADGRLLPAFDRANLTAQSVNAITVTAANGNIQLGAATAGIAAAAAIATDQLVATARAIDITTATASNGNLKLTSTTNDVTLQTGDARSTATIDANRNAIITSLTARTQALTITTHTGDVFLSAGTAQTDATVSAAANARIGMLTATTGNLAITATTGSISGLAPGAPGSLLPDFGRSTLTAGGTGTLTAANGTIQLGTVNTAGALTGNAQAIDITTATTGGVLTLTSSTGDIILGTGTAQTDATLIAASNARIGTLTATTGNLAITAANGSISGLAPGAPGSLLPDFGRAMLTAGGTGTLTAANGTIQLGTVNTAGALTGNAQAIDITTATTGGNLALTTTLGDIILVAGTAQTNATLAAAANARIGTLTATTGNLAITATTGSISGLAPGAPGSLLPDFGRSTLTAGGTGTLTAANGTIQLGTVGTGGALTGSAQALDISAATTGAGNLTLTSTTGDTILGTGTAQVNAVIAAANSARIGSLTARTGTIAVTATKGDIGGAAGAGAIFETRGSAQAIALTADLGLATLGAVTTVNGPVTLTVADAQLLGTVKADAGTIKIVRGSKDSVTRIGDAASATIDRTSLNLDAAEINRLKATTVQVISTPLAGKTDSDVRIGALAIATDTGATRLQFLGTGIFTLSGRISDAGAVARTLQIGGTDAALPPAAGITPATPLAARIDATINTGTAGAIIDLPQATLDLRGQRIDFATGTFLTEVAAATGALGDTAAAQKVATDFVANAGSNLYHDAAVNGSGKVYLAARLLQVSYSSYALFQNTGTPAVGAGVVIGVPGHSAIAPTVLELRSLGETPVNAFALFGTVNEFFGRTAGLLPGAVLSFADGDGGGRIVRITQSNSRVNGCVIGSPDKGCLVTDVPPPILRLFDQRQLQLFGVADDLTVPFDPLIGSSNESLIGDITTTGGVGDCTLPDTPNCPVQGERP